MVTQSALGKIPLPQGSDRVNGPGAFSDFAKKVEDIAVIPYANATSRTNAYTAVSPSRAPVEGTLTYLMDTNVFEFYTGTGWAPVLPDNYPRGVVRALYVDNAYPATGYIPVNADRRVSDTILTNLTLTHNRIYRVSCTIAIVDGGPASSPSTGGAAILIKYTNTASAPSTTSANFTIARCSILSDDSTRADSTHAERIWTPPATGPYSFALIIHAYNSKGVRIFGPRSLVVEDLGKYK